MSLAAALLIIAFSAALAGAFSILVHRLVRFDVRRRHHDVGTAIFLQLGVIFAVLLAFVFSEVWSGYNDAANSIEVECGTLESAAVLATALPRDDALRVLHSEAAYVDEVVHHEWREMFEHRRGDVEADELLRRAILVAAQIPDSGEAGRVGAQILHYVEQAHTERITRVFQLGSGVPMFLWVLLIVFGAVLSIFVGFSSVEGKYLLCGFSITFAAAVSGILVLIHLLDYPFEGALALSPDHFVYTLGKITALAQALH